MRGLTTALAAAALGVSSFLALPASSTAVDESCPSGRVALTFDDGSSHFRPQTLEILRRKLVPATFFEVGMRVAANPHLSRFAVREGHTVFNHTYRHENLGSLSTADVRYELLSTERVFRDMGVAMPFKGMREPFGGGNDASRELIAELGYANIGADVGGADFIPGTPAPVIREMILNGLEPGAIILMHDGPVDTTAGAAVIEALPEVIDGVRARGYCFGSISPKVEVVPDRLTPSRQRIPRIVNPVPYRPNALPLPYRENVAAGLPPLSPPGPYAVVSGLSVRYLSVEIADLRAKSAITSRFAGRLEALVDAAETAQIRGNVARQRDQLDRIAAATRAAPSKEVNASARQRLLALTERMRTSMEDT